MNLQIGVSGDRGEAPSACTTSAPALIATAAMRQSISLRTGSPRAQQVRYSAAAAS
jgi:hypothetical protein